TTEDVELTTDCACPRYVVGAAHRCSCCPCVGGYVVIPQRVDHNDVGISASRHIQVAVYHSRSRSSKACGCRDWALGCEGVGYRVVLPCLEEGWCDATRGVASHQVDLVVVVPRCHERPNIGHVGTSGPQPRSHVVDAGGVDHCGSADVLPTEYEDLV